MKKQTIIAVIFGLFFAFLTKNANAQTYNQIVLDNYMGNAGVVKVNDSIFAISTINRIQTVPETAYMLAIHRLNINTGVINTTYPNGMWINNDGCYIEKIGSYIYIVTNIFGYVCVSKVDPLTGQGVSNGLLFIPSGNAIRTSKFGGKLVILAHDTTWTKSGLIVVNPSLQVEWRQDYSSIFYGYDVSASSAHDSTIFLSAIKPMQPPFYTVKSKVLAVHARDGEPMDSIAFNGPERPVALSGKCNGRLLVAGYNPEIGMTRMLELNFLNHHKIVRDTINSFITKIRKNTCGGGVLIGSQIGNAGTNDFITYQADKHGVVIDSSNCSVASNVDENAYDSDVDGTVVVGLNAGSQYVLPQLIISYKVPVVQQLKVAVIPSKSNNILNVYSFEKTVFNPDGREITVVDVNGKTITTTNFTKINLDTPGIYLIKDHKNNISKKVIIL